MTTLDTRNAANARRMNGTLVAVAYARVSTDVQVEGLWRGGASGLVACGPGGAGVGVG
jgi:hypothetical protein